MNDSQKMGELDESVGLTLHGEIVSPVEELGDEVSPLVVDAVGNALQAHFQAIADMPLPDRLLVLLAELEARERSQ